MTAGEVERFVSSRSRDEHLEWVKEQALGVLGADVGGTGVRDALVCLISDLGRHPGTAGHDGIGLTTVLLLRGRLSTAEQVRAHIEWFA